MKKTILSILSIIMCCCICVSPVMAAENNFEKLSAEKYAYMSLKDADGSLHDTIISARNEIILNTSWVADNVNGRVVDEEGNVVEELPHFSEVFPAEWEIPNIDTHKGSSVGIVDVANSRSWNTAFNETVTLRTPSNSTITPPFYTMATSAFLGTPYAYYVKTISTLGYNSVGNTYNIGYSNADTGASLGVKTNLAEGLAFEIDPPRNIEVAIRASSYDSPGQWLMMVTGDRYDY